MKIEKFFNHNATASDSEKTHGSQHQKRGFFYLFKQRTSWLIMSWILIGYGLLTAYPCVKPSVKGARNYLIYKASVCYTCARIR